MLFWVDLRYLFQDTDQNVHSSESKPVLWHSLFFFYNFRCYLESIGGIVAKIRAKTFIRRLWNRFLVNCCYILDVILSRSDVHSQRYGRKRSLAGFETGFTAFGVLFLLLWWLIKVDWRYFCQVMGVNVHLTVSKSVLHYSLFYFWNIGSYFELIWCTVAKIRKKTFIHWLWDRF